MKKPYKVLKATVVEGSPEREGATVFLTEEEAKVYPSDVIGKFQTDDEKDAGEKIDQSPTELATDGHETKRAGSAETAADKKAAKAEEK